MKTNKPFEDRIQEILEERGLSVRELCRRMQESYPIPLGEWSDLAGYPPDENPMPSHTTVNRIVTGESPVTPRMIERIAYTLGPEVSPEHFAEYRLDLARERLEWRDPDPETRRRRLALALRELEASR